VNKVIALTGMCGSGKSAAAAKLEEKGFAKVYFGGITMNELKKRGMEISESNERMIREELRQKHGMAAFALLSISEINRLLENNKKVFIDGLYSWSEYRALRETYGENIVLLEIFSDKNIRYDRLAQRKIRPLTREQAAGRDITEIENIEKGGPIAFSDYKLENNGSLTELYRRLEKILDLVYS